MGSDSLTDGNSGGASDCGASDHQDTSTVYSEERKQELDPTLAQNETRAVNITRVFMVLVLVGVAATVSYFAFEYARETEQEFFERSFLDQATKLTEAFSKNADKRMTALRSFSQSITTYSLSSGNRFPFVTVPDFERQAVYALKLSDSPAVLIFPVVTAENRSEWELYSNSSQGWLQESWQAQSEVLGQLLEAERDEIDALREETGYDEGLNLDTEDADQRVEDRVITPIIFKVDAATGGVALEDGPGPYAPIWQHAPVLSVPSLVNFNSWSHPTRYRELTTLLQIQKPLLSSAADFRDDDPLTANRKMVMNLFLNRWQNGTYDYDEGPVSDVYFPIFDSNGPDKQMKSVLTAYVYWQAFFQDILPEDAVGVYVTLKNSCNQSFSYEINGKTATYLGKGDLHERKYDHMMLETGYGAVLGAANVPDDTNSTSGTTQCHYNVQVFPSQVMEDEFMTTTPMLFSGCLASIFCFTCLVFLLYDWCVGRRHRKVHDTAVKSGAVVRSLFPAKVVDRLYQSAEKKDAIPMLNTKDNMDVFRKDSRDRLSLEKMNRDQSSYGDIALSDPIADLYPDCTVYFADIAGFTKWSTGRPPCDVFRFLETLYSAFDKTAKERGVFKIETIGDCYVAVTGLPDRQPNHAVRMVRFAAECMVQMNQVLHKLVPVLGPETAFLSMRAGLHSGAVTAGILRGEKARFQLFGDTVNTAARMESTSQAGMIQVSEATAVLLMKRGKGNWLRLREDAVAPKGKGVMTTYWVEPKGLDAGATESMLSNDDARAQMMSPRTPASKKRGRRNTPDLLKGSDHTLKDSDHTLKDSDHTLKDSDHSVKDSDHSVKDSDRSPTIIE